ncbi:MAG: UDP-N-acetylmuramoyl-L-alanyl-D-glutamate--2,6-diaminopimelate ligase, partial [Parcubacteria group bacterium Athens0714_25]
MKKLIPQKLKNYYHLLWAVIANFWYGFPSKKIKVIGVTGTNGKTTTVQMIARILEEAGFRVAVASTINFKLNGKE